MHGSDPLCTYSLRINLTIVFISIITRLCFHTAGFSSKCCWLYRGRFPVGFDQPSHQVRYGWTRRCIATVPERWHTQVAGRDALSTDTPQSE